MRTVYNETVGPNNKFDVQHWLRHFLLMASIFFNAHILKFKYALFWVFLLDNVIICKCIANTFASVSATLLSAGNLWYYNIILLGIWGINGARLQSPHARDVLIRIFWISFSDWSESGSMIHENRSLGSLCNKGSDESTLDKDYISHLNFTNRHT